MCVILMGMQKQCAERTTCENYTNEQHGISCRKGLWHITSTSKLSESTVFKRVISFFLLLLISLLRFTSSSLWAKNSHILVSHYHFPPSLWPLNLNGKLKKKIPLHMSCFLQFTMTGSQNNSHRNVLLRSDCFDSVCYIMLSQEEKFHLFKR